MAKVAHWASTAQILILDADDSSPIAQFLSQLYRIHRTRPTLSVPLDGIVRRFGSKVEMTEGLTASRADLKPGGKIIFGVPVREGAKSLPPNPVPIVQQCLNLCVQSGFEPEATETLDPTSLGQGLSYSFFVARRREPGEPPPPARNRG